ncbi:Alpha,alpha-trehalose-phosphate synthase [UDP-forming] [Neolecta irregularis DAH-3]|uniref:Alpha,alpha-trehalose-phosphate synthase [UDP-forming] n=1 Tax=Neolecta irregularis (strain DAH-3) TaxID=1198029 RepID=A0A1U7LIM1_NEOID|nr:Alpha,alpha-trehalose-phosphate synthase [UDP-forming] [Neolecta irregularis DAH-3]|eukprot:OLL22494.1 Alpha,alpha-trehalose-phosphate synthase [UDP-forming] [Neolecta irregularis DAH-3]
MILSEFAGAAQSLNGSIIVNPWSTEELAAGIYDAVTMSDDLRETNHQKLYRYVTKYTSKFWGQTFVGELKRISEQAEKKVIVGPSADITQDGKVT